MQQLPLTSRIYLGYGLVGLITLAMVGIAFHGINTLSSRYELLNNRLTVLNASNELGRNASEMQSYAEFFIANGRNVTGDSVNSVYRKSLTQINTLTDQGFSDQALRIKHHLKNFNDAFIKAREQRTLRDQLVNIEIPGIVSQWETHLTDYKRQNLSQSALAMSNKLMQSTVLIQRYINQYFSTLDAKHLTEAYQLIQEKREIIQSLFEQPNTSIQNDHLKSLASSLKEGEIILYEGVQRVRGYLTLINVIMAAESYETRYLAKQLADEQQTLTEQLQAETEQVISSLTLQLIMLSFLFMIATLIISTVIGRSITNPIEQLQDLFNRLANSERNIKIPTYGTNDALSALASSAESFREANVQTQILLDQYQELSTELENKVAQRTSALEKANEQLSELTIRDPLTGLFNRRHLDEEFLSLFKRAQRSHLPLAVLMFDIDHFKQYNDHYGHQAGDKCLKQVAGILDQVFHRTTDIVARFGGEEFVVVLFDTDVNAAMSLAEETRNSIMEAAIEHSKSAHNIVTICGGVATMNHRTPIKNPEKLISFADDALYRSKELGRNRITLFTKEQTSI